VNPRSTEASQRIGLVLTPPSFEDQCVTIYQLQLHAQRRERMTTVLPARQIDLAQFSAMPQYYSRAFVQLSEYLPQSA